MACVLIVDDEPSICRVLKLYLNDRGYDVDTCGNAEDALRQAASKTYDVVVLDFSLPGMSGLDALKRLRDRNADLSCILMTAYGSIRSAVDAMRCGATDYLPKPFDNDELVIAIDKALSVRRLTAEVKALRSALEARYGFSEIIGTSQAMQDIFRVMSRIAANDSAVLILGESGTGKELVARAIHRRSMRAGAPFVAVNCSAIPETLVEAEFFGVERGAFTDAKESRPGRFELANRGTLFLDEIGDLPLSAQAKLLRALQEHEILRLGARRPVPVDVRVLAATNKDLQAEVKSGRFREDLYYRLDVLSVRLPPLRERAEDLSLLIDHLLETLGRETNPTVKAVSPEARRLLLAYHWPGNVRELENTLRRALLLADGSALQAADLPPRIRGEAGQDAGLSGPDGMTLGEAVHRTVERVERALIQAAILASRGNRTLAAESLGINRKTLFNKMKAYGLASDDETAD